MKSEAHSLSLLGACLAMAAGLSPRDHLIYADQTPKGTGIVRFPRRRQGAHQGERECARRRRQLAAEQLDFTASDPAVWKHRRPTGGRYGWVDWPAS